LTSRTLKTKLKTSRYSTLTAFHFCTLKLTLGPVEQSEISILSSLDSPYVTKYEGSWLRGTELWIVMEYLSGGSCGDLLKPGVFKEEYIAIVVRELLKGLEYLHGEGKLHRDIKGLSYCRFAL
jgi:serine/threonine protein kinase